MDLKGRRCSVLPLALLLLAAVLLSEASGEVETGRREPQEELRECKKECRSEEGDDPRRQRECEEKCERRCREQEEGQSGRGSRGEDEDCQRECRDYRHHPWWHHQCVRRCERRREEGEGEDCNHHGSEEKCWRQCQHHQDWRKKQECLRDCEGGSDDDNNGSVEACKEACKWSTPMPRAVCEWYCEHTIVEGPEGGRGDLTGEGARSEEVCKGAPMPMQVCQWFYQRMVDNSHSGDDDDYERCREHCRYQRGRRLQKHCKRMCDERYGGGGGDNKNWGMVAGAILRMV